MRKFLRRLWGGFCGGMVGSALFFLANLLFGGDGDSAYVASFYGGWAFAAFGFWIAGRIEEEEFPSEEPPKTESAFRAYGRTFLMAVTVAAGLGIGFFLVMGARKDIGTLGEHISRGIRNTLSGGAERPVFPCDAGSRTATNPTTGERMTFFVGSWVPCLDR